MIRLQFFLLNCKCCTIRGRRTQTNCTSSISIFVMNKFKWAHSVWFWVCWKWQTGPPGCPNTQNDDTVIHHQSDAPNKTTVEDLFHHSVSCCRLTSVTAYKKRNKHQNICRRTQLLLRAFLMSWYLRQPAEHSESKDGDELCGGSQGECARMQMDCQLW